jgi:hypothetical protein
MERDLDLPVDLNSEDESTLRWGLSEDARDPASIVEGAWIIVGSGRVRAVAQVAEIEDGVVRVRPLPGPLDKYRHLLKGGVA